MRMMEDMRQKEQKFRRDHDRMKQQIEDLQAKNKELQDEIKYFE